MKRMEAYTAEQVDDVIAKFEKCAQRQNAYRGSEVRLRASERDLLQVAEKVRDLLVLAVKSDKALLSEVFGGSCYRFHSLRRAMDTVEFSSVQQANDQRWRDLSNVMTSIEEVLKQLGIFRPAMLERKAALQITSFRGYRARFQPGQRVAMKPNCEGDMVEAWRVEPGLPDCLVLNAITGEITGMLKPGVEVPERAYLVTASAAQIEQSIELAFSVALPAPKSLAYPELPEECYTSETVAWAAEVQGGAPREWSVAPDLPTGLALDPRTGAIAGMPEAIAEPAEYTVTAGNLSGRVWAVLQFGVQLAPPIGLAYPGSQKEYLLGAVVYLTPEVTLKTSAAARRPASANWQSVGRKFLPSGLRRQSWLERMPALQFSVEPPLPDGLVLAPKTGRISGKPLAPAEEATYTVTCCNDRGRATMEFCFAIRLKPPANLRYPELSPVYFTGRPLTLSPEVDGLASEWKVVPELPAGLYFDSVLGIISGMPTEVVPESSWRVVVRNADGEADVTLTFAVQCAAPAGLTYPSLEEQYAVHRQLAIQPTVEGEVQEYTVDPALPEGIKLDPVTGVVHGTPPSCAAKTAYSVTARNETGSTSVTLIFAVSLMPPECLSYPQVDDVYNVRESVALEPQVIGGPTSWTVEPTLPKGLLIDECTGRIHGAPVSLAGETSYVVTAMNEAGGTSAVLTFSVIAPKPEDLCYPMACDEYAIGGQILLEPQLSSGYCVNFTVTPNLPKGLLLDPETGVISGVINTATPPRTYRVTAVNPTGSTSVDMTFSCTTTVDAITGVDQQFATMLEEVTDVAKLVEEPAKEVRLGDWMVWMVHRAWLNDPTLTDLNFSGKYMPHPSHEPRIAPKLMKALAHNTHLVSLQLADSNMMKPQGHEMAESLSQNTALQVLNIETNNLDSASIKHIAEALLENPSSCLEQFKLSNQRAVGETFGRAVEQAVGELMDKNTRIVKLGFSCSDAHWRLMIDRAILRNNDYARRRRKRSTGGSLEDELAAQEKPLSRLLLAIPPNVAAWEVFDEEDQQVAIARSYVASLKRLPTKEQLQSFTRGLGRPLPYSAVAPLAKTFRTKLLDAALGCQIDAIDAYGAGFSGILRAWSEKNERWSLDVWTDDGARFNFTAVKQPTIEVSPEFATWQQPLE